MSCKQVVGKKNLPTLDEVLCYKNWEIKTSTGDGHCLLYSIVTSWNSQSGLPPIDLHELKCKFFVEAIRNYDIYSAFMITPNQNSYFTQMRKYIVDKMYDNDIVDVAPVILSTALMAKIDILHITSSYVEKTPVSPLFIDTGNTITVVRSGDHYNGLIVRNNLTIDSHSKTPSSCTKTSNVITYSNSDLYSIRNSDINVKRNVRKRLFHLKLWRPKTGRMSNNTWSPVSGPTSNSTGHYLRHRGRSAHNLIILHHPTKWLLPTLLNTNAQSLLLKLDDLQATCDLNGIDIAVVSESWISPDQSLNLFQLEGYSLSSNCRLYKKGGGITCYIKNSIPWERWEHLEDPTIESLWITARPKLLPREFPIIVIGAIYHPPGAKDWNMIQHIQFSLESILQKHPHAGIFITGDFNQLKVAAITSGFHLCQIVKTPTRGKNVLDKILTNMQHFYSNPSLVGQLRKSDHLSVIAVPKIDPKTKCALTVTKMSRPITKAR